MMRVSKKIAMMGLAALAMAGGTLATAGPASAATYGGQCGSGYSVVNQLTISGEGTVFLTYNSSNGNNCVVTIRNNPGTRLSMDAGVSRSVDPSYISDPGSYTTYAGPVYRNAKGYCVDWYGMINGVYAYGWGTNCG